jgi:hypothetical protein
VLTSTLEDVMNRIVVALIVGLCVLGGGPRPAAAQCHESCVVFYSPDGKIIGRGCEFNPDSPTTCLATARVCFMGDCGGAFVTDGNGTLLAQADICRDKVTLRSVSRALAAKVPPTIAYDARTLTLSTRLQPHAIASVTGE